MHKVNCPTKRKGGGGRMICPNFQTAAGCFIVYDSVHEGMTFGRYKRPFYQNTINLHNPVGTVCTIVIKSSVDYL